MLRDERIDGAVKSYAISLPSLSELVGSAGPALLAASCLPLLPSV